MVLFASTMSFKSWIPFFCMNKRDSPDMFAGLCPKLEGTNRNAQALMSSVFQANSPMPI